MHRQPIAVSLVGAGYMASEYAKCLMADSRFKISGILSRNYERAFDFATSYNIPIIAKSMEELYEKSHSDILIITTPEMATLNVSLSAFSFPWILLIEKPVGIDLDQSSIILDAYLKSNAQGYVALNRRFYDSTSKALHLFDEDNGNRIIQICDQQDLIAARLSGQPEKVLENWMYANSIHLIDYINLFARGEVLEINTRTEEFQDTLFVNSNITFSSRDFVSYFCIWNGPGGWSVNIRDKSIEVRLEPLEKIWIRRFPSRTLELESDLSDSRFKPGLQNMLDQLFNLVTTGNSELPNLKASHDLMKLVKEIYKGINVPE